MKGLLEEFFVDSLLTTDEWDYIQWQIDGDVAHCESGGDLDPRDLPFVSRLEDALQARLGRAGFKKEVVEDRQELEKIIRSIDSNASRHWTTHRFDLDPPYGLPAGSFTLGEDKHMFWVKPHVEAALRALACLSELKGLMVDNGAVNDSAVRVYLRTLQMAMNLSRSGNVPGLARAEAEKRDNSKWSREIKKMVMGRAVERVFEVFPRDKTLGVVWSKFNYVNKGKPFIVVNKDTGKKKIYNVEVGSDRNGRDVVVISGDGMERFEYSKRSLQRFINQMKEQGSTTAQ